MNPKPPASATSLANAPPLANAMGASTTGVRIPIKIHEHELSEARVLIDTQETGDWGIDGGHGCLESTQVSP